jgi:calcium/calmodulin-dependent protein kinase (CaM kinase) II
MNPMSNDPAVAELLALNQRLLESISAADWATYEALCDESLSAFEPEGRGQLIEGLAFHRYYFERGGTPGAWQVTMASPKVRLLGEAAVVSYVRLVQKLDGTGSSVTLATEETRIWQRRDGRWRHVHFHRSAPTTR